MNGSSSWENGETTLELDVPLCPLHNETPFEDVKSSNFEGSPPFQTGPAPPADSIQLWLVHSPGPRVVPFNSGIVNISAGDYHNAIVSDQGEVYTFGENDRQQLGFKSDDTTGPPVIDVPTRVPTLENVTVVEVACGSAHTLAVTNTGRIIGWGSSEWGQLASRGSMQQPRVIKDVIGKVRALAATAGGERSFVICSDGNVYAFGNSSGGSLGVNCDQGEHYFIPRPMMSLWAFGVVQVSCGSMHAGVVTVQGRALLWGRNKYGNLGCGDTLDRNHATEVKGLHGVVISRIACGGDHTLMLSGQGVVYSMGRGSFGQTGLNHTENQAYPKVISHLSEYRILKIAAGLRHSVVSTSAQEVFGFGAADSGQIGSELTSIIPVKVQGLPNECIILSLEAGGDHSLVLVDRSRTLGVVAASRIQHEAMPIAVPQLDAILVAAEESNVQSSSVTLEAALEISFSSPRFLLTAFQDQDPNRVFERIFRLAKEKVSLIGMLGSCCVRMFDNMESWVQYKHDGGVDFTWVAPALFILLQNPLNSDGGVGGTFVYRIGRIISSVLPPDSRVGVRRSLEALLMQLSPDIFGARCVRPVQRHLTSLAESGRMASSRVELFTAAVLLDVLRGASVSAGGLIPETEFSNAAVSDAANLYAEYNTWLSLVERSSNQLGSLCQVPFILTPQAKTRILHGEAAGQKHQAAAGAAMRALMSGYDPAMASFLQIYIRRESVVEDALNQLVLAAENVELKKPLRVTFLSAGVPEPADDAGGVTKEFFQLLTRDLFRSEYGMFVWNEVTRTHWFSMTAAFVTDLRKEYVLIGLCLGLAIYNGVLLDARLPLLLYKMVLGGRPSFQDLKDVFPELAKGLQDLLDFEGDVESTFCRSFEVEYEFFGEMKRVELKDQGSSIAVTDSNREEFVELYTNWMLEKSIKDQFEAFKHGFLQVAGGPALSLFFPRELQLLVEGLPHLNFEALQKSSRYEGGYTKDSQIVQWLWQIVKHDFDLSQKKKFLHFVTGSSRAPINGLGDLRIVVQRAGPDSEMLPSTHTCFNSILLPEYSSQAKLKEKLRTALENAEGFGLH